MIVLITSLTSRRARRYPQIPPQSAPAAAPAVRIARMATKCGHRASIGPIAPAASAPAINWPSAPIFQSAPWNATATARPVKTSGVDFTSVSVNASQLPNAPCPSAIKTPTGDAPSASKMSEIREVATSNAAKGFAIVLIAKLANMSLARDRNIDRRTRDYRRTRTPRGETTIIAPDIRSRSRRLTALSARSK